MEKNNPIIYAVSDSIGETAESVVKATISQFVEQNFEVVRVPYVKDKEQIERLVQEAAEHNAVICYTLVSPELREHLADRALAHPRQHDQDVRAYPGLHLRRNMAGDASLRC